MFEKLKEKNRQKAEERERQLQARKQALLAMSEKNYLLKYYLKWSGLVTG